MSTAVRKRVLRLLRDLYHKSDNQIPKAAIVTKLLSRITDMEENIKVSASEDGFLLQIHQIF